MLAHLKNGIFRNFSRKGGEEGGGHPNSQNVSFVNTSPKKPLTRVKITQKFLTWPKKIGKKWSKFPKGGGGGSLWQLVPQGAQIKKYS